MRSRSQSRLWRQASAAACLVACSLLLSSCIVTYTDFPKIRADALHLSNPGKHMAYSIDRYPMFMGNRDVLGPIFQGHGGFSSAERVEQDNPPGRGLYTRVNVKAKNPTLGAAIWGYVAVLGTLTFLPAYSGQDGYEVVYTMMVDGETRKVYRYEITRKAGAWLLLLPLIWVNLLTPSEADAFKATAYQFLADAERDGVI